MHALITGASSGIGEALAIALAREGYDLTLVARRESELERVAEATGRRTKITILPYDLADLGGLENLVAKAESALGPIDLLVNNAGIQILGRCHEFRLEDYDRQFAINLQAPLRLTRAVAPGMIARRRGTIVDIVSLAAITHTPYMAGYSASKAGLAAASITHRAELRPHGVHVVTVYPGPVRTAMGHNGASFYEAEGGKGLPPLPWGTPEGLAKLVVAAIRHKRATVIYPRSYAVARLFPRLSQWMTEILTPRLAGG